MLRNRYVIAVVGVLLVLVLYYNVSFFSEKRAVKAVRQGDSPAFVETAERAAGTPAARTGEWKRDPFWYTDKNSRSRAGAASRGSGLALAATMTKDGKGYALIGDRVVGVGETLNGYTVVDVGQKSVTIKNHNGTRVLTIGR
jgi:hypothetical protein